MGGLSLAQEDVSTLFPVSSPARPPEPVTSRRRPLERGLRMFLTQRTTRWDCSFRWLDTVFHGQYLPSLKLNKLRRHKQRFEKIATTVVLDKDETTMRWNCMSKALCLLQITVEHQDCPYFTVFVTIKTSSQSISITLLQILLKLHERRGGYWRKKPPWKILIEQFLVPRNTAASKVGNGVISLLWQLRCHCNPDHNKFPSLSYTTVVPIFPYLCLWRRSLCSNVGGIDPEKLYRATLNNHRRSKRFHWDRSLVKKSHWNEFPPFLSIT